MTKGLPVLILLAVGSLPTASRAVEKELLQRLAAHQEKVDHALKEGSFTVSLVGQELDSDGKPKKHSESVRRVSSQGGERHTEVVSASEDGKDTTAEERKKQAARDEKRKASKEPPKGSNIASPFEPAEQAKLFFWTLGADAKTGFVRIGFRPKGARSDDIIEGEALVDPVRGETVSLSMRPSKMPTFVDKMDLELRFDAAVDGTRLLSSLKIAGEGGIAFVRRRGSAVTTFSDYSIPTPPR